ncbi:MAG: hypothetical protein R6V53_06500 [Candidatus Woesearchaeota archaeon]
MNLMSDKRVIETGIDKLLSIIKEKKRITVEDAAKALGVSPTMTEEWGDFLEDEGYIRKEHKLTKVYFVLKDIDFSKLVEKADEIDQKKDGFANKAEVGLQKIKKDSAILQDFKEQFEKLKSDISKEFKAMKVDISELERYENFKEEVEKKLRKYDSQFSKKFDSISNDIISRKKEYEKLTESVDKEKERIESERSKIDGFQKQSNEIKQNLNQLFKEFKEINKGIQDSESKISKSRKSMQNDLQEADKIGEEISKKNQELKNLIEENNAKKKQVESEHKEILDSISKKTGSIEKKSKNFKEDRFKEFFNRKRQIEKLIKDVENEQKLVETELVDLIKKSRAFKASLKSKNIEKQIKEIEQRLKSANDKMQAYDEKIKEIAGTSKKRWF